MLLACSCLIFFNIIVFENHKNKMNFDHQNFQSRKFSNLEITELL